MARVLLLPITNKVSKSLVRIVCNSFFFICFDDFFPSNLYMRIFLWVIKQRLEWIFPAYNLYLTQRAANEMFNFHFISNIQHVTKQHPQYKQEKNREKRIFAWFHVNHVTGTLKLCSAYTAMVCKCCNVIRKCDVSCTTAMDGKIQLTVAFVRFC